MDIYLGLPKMMTYTLGFANLPPTNNRDHYETK